MTDEIETLEAKNRMLRARNDRLERENKELRQRMPRAGVLGLPVVSYPRELQKIGCVNHDCDKCKGAAHG